MTDTAPGAPAAAIEIDYDKLAEAMDRRRALVPAASIMDGPQDLGPYPHSFVDGLIQPHLSGENCTDALTRELAGLEPLDDTEAEVAVPGLARV